MSLDVILGAIVGGALAGLVGTQFAFRRARVELREMIRCSNSTGVPAFGEAARAQETFGRGMTPEMTSPVSGRRDWVTFTPGDGSGVVWRPPDDVLRCAHKAMREGEAAAAAGGLGPEAHDRAGSCPGSHDCTPDWRVTQQPGSSVSADGRSPSVVTSTWSSPWAESLFPGNDFYAQELRSEFAELLAEHGHQGRSRSLEDLRVFASSFLPARVQREEQSAWKDAELQRWRLYQRLIDYELTKAAWWQRRERPGPVTSDVSGFDWT